MKLNYFLLFSLILIFFLAMNFISAEEIDENFTDESLKIDFDSQDFMHNSYQEQMSNDNEEINDLNELLENSNSIKDVYVSPDGDGDGASAISPKSFYDALDELEDNTVIHMADGNYTLQITSSSNVYLESNNVMVMADNLGKVMLTTTMNDQEGYEIEIEGASNVTFKNIVFHSSPKVGSVFGIYDSEVFFENCSFINYPYVYYQIIEVSGASNAFLNSCYFINNTVYTIIYQMDDSITSINRCTFENTKNLFANDLDINSFYIQSGNFNAFGCNFINDTCNQVFYLTPNTYNQETVETNISYCVFRGNKANVLVKPGANLIFENNTVDSEYAVELTGGSFISNTTVTVLNNTRVTVGSGESIDVTFTLTDDKGNNIKVPKIKFMMDTKSKTATYKDGVYSVEYAATKLGDVYIDAIEPDYVNMANLTILKQDPSLVIKPTLNMSADDISNSTYGEYITVKVNISNLESGNLVYEFVNNNDFTKTVPDSFTNNVSTISLNDLPAGDYTLTVKYAEDDDFAASTITKTFSISKANSTILDLIVDPTIPVGENITVKAVLPANARGNVTYRLNTNETTVNVTDKAIFAGLANGTYTIYAKYNGDDNYNASEWYNVTFQVVKTSPGLTISAEPVTYGEPLVVVVNTNTKFTGDVLVKIDNLNQTAHVVNGVGNASFANLTAAEYFITAIFTENDMFIAETKNTTAVVNGIVIPVDQAVNTTVPANSKSPTFSINMPEDATGNFTVSVDGKTVETKELVNGKASITVKDLSAGDHNISIAYTGDSKYAPIIDNTTLTINKLSTSISASAVSTVYGVSKKLTITLKDANNKLLAGKTVKVVLNGVTYTGTTDAKGQVSITVPNSLAVKTYTAKVTFAGDSEYLNSAKDVKVTVKKATSKLTAKKKTFKAKKKTKKYTVTLKANNKAVKKVKLTLKVKGKTYKATTNAKGKATFKLNKLTKKGKHTATIKFKGNKNLKAATKKVKITIK